MPRWRRLRRGPGPLPLRGTALPAPPWPGHCRRRCCRRCWAGGRRWRRASPPERWKARHPDAGGLPGCRLRRTRFIDYDCVKIRPLSVRCTQRDMEARKDETLAIPGLPHRPRMRNSTRVSCRFSIGCRRHGRARVRCHLSDLRTCCAGILSRQGSCANVPWPVGRPPVLWRRRLRSPV